MKATSDFITYTIEDRSSEDTGYPVSNLFIYTSSTESFRTTGITDQFILLDLAQAYEDPIVLLYGANFSTVSFNGDDNPLNFDTPTFSTSNFTIEKDVELLIYKRSFILTGFNHRYLQIFIPAQTPVDGEDYFELGVVAIMESLEEFEATGDSLGLPVQNNFVSSEVMNRFVSGRKEIIPYGEFPVMEYQITGTMRSSVTNREKMVKVFGHPLKPITYLERSIENTWQVYLIQRTGSMNMSETAGGNTGIRTYSVTYETIL